MDSILIEYTYKTINSTKILQISTKNLLYSTESRETLLKVELSNEEFIKNVIIDDLFKSYKSEMDRSYNEVKNMNQSDIIRPKNSSTRNLIINIDDSKYNIDMFISNYDNVFEEFVNALENIISIEVDKQK